PWPAVGARGRADPVSTATRPDWATVPNLVTLVRFVMLAPVCVLLVDGPDTLAVVLLLVWASTDWVDGLLARALGQASRTGAIIDPIADRIGLAARALCLPLPGPLPSAALVVIVVLDVAVLVPGTGPARGGRIPAHSHAKIRTFVLRTAVYLPAEIAAC